MIQCVGSRNDERPYCSRVCCTNAIKNAISIKEETPDTDVVILFRDVMTYGFLEKYYLQARKAGRPVHAVRQGVAACRGAERRFPVHDLLRSVAYGRDLTFDTDLVALERATIATGQRGAEQPPQDTENARRFFLEAHMKLRPVDFASDGIYLCGPAHSPKNIKETITQAEAVGRQGVHDTIQGKDAVGGVVADVQGEKCAACLTCVRACPYSVPVINDKGEAEIDISKCKGCGSCAAECPAKAIDLMHYSDVQIEEKVRALCAK